MAKAPERPVGFDAHDHSVCVEEGLRAAEAQCAEQGLKLTPIRRQVLGFLLKEHRALGAYAILDLLNGAGHKPHPAVAYRALDFLAKHGFVHRIERLNAFVACVHPHESHSPAFMICRVCENVAEAHISSARHALGKAAQATGFQIEKMVLEAEGICPDCKDTASL
jgi:Fur family zinc uptake transcriptional regulator